MAGSKSNGGATMTYAQFKINLHHLHVALKTVATEAAKIRVAVGEISSTTQSLATTWTSPAGLAFGQLQASASTSMWGLVDILDQVAAKLQNAYDNYREMEMQNTRNLT